MVIAALSLLVLAAVGVGAIMTRRLLAQCRRHQRRIDTLESRLVAADWELTQAHLGAKPGDWNWDPDSGALVCTEEASYVLTGGVDKAPKGFDQLLALLHPDDRSNLIQCLRDGLDGKDLLECEYRILRADGDVRFIHQRATAERSNGRTLRLLGTVTDITETTRARLQQETGRRVIDLIGNGAPLSDVLETIATSVEALDQSLLCSIMLLDAGTHRLQVGAAPHLPEALIAAMEGEGQSKTATHPVGERLLVADLLYHPYWQTLSGASDQAGVRACLSEPICDADGQVLGAFDVYSRIQNKPDTSQLAYIGLAASLVAMALRHERDRNARLAAEERARLLLDSANEGIFGLDLDGVTTFINPIGAHMLGYEPADLVGRSNHSVIHHTAQDGDAIDPMSCRMLQVMRTGQDIHVSDEVLWRRDGSYFPVEYRATPIRSNGPIIGAVVIFHDITSRKRREQYIHRLAFFDGLTGLANRGLLKARLSKRLQTQRREQGGFALHFLDLDRFKDVNDTLGHPVGDQLLKETARRLESMVRDTDTVARFGGDEFAVIQPDARDVTDAATLAEKIVTQLAAPYRIDGHEILCGASVGIVFVANDPTDAETILSRADVALYKAKKNGRGRYAFHTDEMTQQVRRDTALTDRLDQAVRDGELFLHYQPQVEINTGRVVAVEALVRWHHPVEGILPPGDFIHLAERHGLFHLLGGWVIANAAAQAKQWQDCGLCFGRVTINVSPQQVRAGALADEVINTAQNTGIDPSLLELEFTETALMEYGSHHRAQVSLLRDAGVRLTIDDFGTGFSSLTYLRQSKASAIKIDRQFVRDLSSCSEATEMVRAVVALAQSLGLDIVAEGVETEEQAELLFGLGCRIAQGVLFAPPMAPDRLNPYLAAGHVTIPDDTGNWTPGSSLDSRDGPADTS